MQRGVSEPQGGPVAVFDRLAVRRQRDRSADLLPDHDFLLNEVGERLVERMGDVRRTFSRGLDLGCRRGALADALMARCGVERMIRCDVSERMVVRAAAPRLVADEEALPFAAGAFDLVVSLLSLHWVNDLPGALLQIRRALRPDGLFLAALLGGDSLRELRQALGAAEIALEGGLSPRLSPVLDVRDAGNLLQRAGFALPMADVETITVSYAQPLRLLHDLRGMGEANKAAGRRREFSRRGTLLDAMRRYRETFADADGRVPARFDVIFLIGWAPDASQAKPLRPGSARARLADALGTQEVPGGERARP
jgi:SAM-dependent methyltransferase